MTVHELFSFLMLFAWKASLVLVLALLYLALLRRSNASTRHAVCAAALSGVLLVPVLMVIAPGFEIAPRAMFWMRINTTASSAAAVLGQQRGEEVRTLVLIAWACGALVLFIRCVAGWAVLRRLRAQSREIADAGWRELWEEWAGSFQEPELRAGPVSVPLTCGVLRPAVLVPEDFQSWSPAQRQTVLLHESAHIRRRDCLWHYIAQVACTLLWFHPVVWILEARLRREEELACDDAVVASGMEPAEYAEILLDTARTLQSPSLLACCMSGRGTGSMRARFGHLLDGNRDHRVARSGKWLVQAVLAFVLAMSFAGATTPEVYKIGGDVSAPRLINKTEPDYTPEAKQAKIQGTVLLSVVIGKNGVVQNVQVTRSLDPGLDVKAMEAIRKWRFAPATRKGKPVAVRAAVEVNFRLL